MAEEMEKDFVVIGEPLAGNAYSASKNLYHSIKRGRDTKYTTETDDVFVEKWTDSLIRKAKERTGGIIIFPEGDLLDEGKRQKVLKCVRKAVIKFNKIIMDKRPQNDRGLYAAWGNGCDFSGKYHKKDGVTFGSESFSVDIIGMPGFAVYDLVDGISRFSTRKTIMVKDFPGQQVYLRNF
jgi:hypothetical protein